MMLALKSGPQIAAKVGNPAGLLCQRIWYSVGKSGVLGITEYRQGRPLSKKHNETILWNRMLHPMPPIIIGIDRKARLASSSATR